MNALLKKADILAVQDLQFEDVEVPEWNGTVRIAGLSGEAAMSFSDRMVELDTKGKVKSVKVGNFMAELLAMTIVNDKFEPVFEEADIKALGKKSAAVLKKLSDVAMRLSGLGETAIEDAEKN